MRRYLIFATASFSLLMSAIDSTVVSVAFPNFTREFGTSVLWSSWTISIFFIAVTMVMPVAGNLADSFGRKKVFLFSLLLFTVSSLACGLAPTISALIAFRFLQGVGGACFLPTASGIVTDHFPANRETAIGLFSSIFSVGAVIGPNLGGWIVSQYSWRYIFYINVPIGMLLMGSAVLLLEDSRMITRPHVDLVGILLMSGSLLFFMLGLNFIGESLSTPFVLSAGLFVIVAVVLALCFLRQEKRVGYPILDVTLLQSRPFLAANVTNLIIGMTMIGVFSFIPLYATSIHGLSTLMSGVILSPRSLAMAVAAAVTSFFLRKWGYRWPMVLGFVLTGLSTMLLAPRLSFWSIPEAHWGRAEMLTFLLLLNGVGGGVVFPAANNACIELLPRKVGTIVGLRNMFRSVGGALAVSLLTLILHISSNPSSGFTIVFILFGLTFLVSLPLLFLMPAGRKAWGG